MAEESAPVDGVLIYLRKRRAHLLEVIPMLEQRRITTHRNHEDTTEETLNERQAELHEVERLLSKHEGRAG